jgi:hypothetical protein
MKCNQFKKNIYKVFTDEEISTEMKQHLEQCDRSQKLLEAVKAVSVEAIDLIEEEVSPFFVTRTEAKLDRILEENTKTSLVGLLKPALLSLFVLFAIGSGILFGKHYAGNNFNNEQVNEQEYNETVSLDSYENYYLSE